MSSAYDKDTHWKCPCCKLVQPMTEYVLGYRARRHALSPTALDGLTAACAGCRKEIPLSIPVHDRLLERLFVGYLN